MHIVPDKTDLFLRTPFAAPMQDVPLQFLDVGSRGGIEPDLLPIAFAVDAVGFEPAAAECDRLNGGNTGPWRSARFIPAALAGKGGTGTLHIAEDPISSSLLPPISETGERFNKTAYCTIVGTAEVETCGLDEAVGRFNIPKIDFIKLDTEGIELDILRSGEQAVAQAIAVKTEVSFMAFRAGQPPAREIDAFLSDRGFELMDLIAPSHWRVHGHGIHPQVTYEQVPYSRAQLAHGDFLYFRHPDKMALDTLDEEGNALRRLKAAWLAMAYGYFDRAEEYLSHPSVGTMLRSRWGTDLEQAVRKSSLQYGRAAWRTALLRQLRDLIPYLRHAGAAMFQR